jgi:hypothetical protein
MNHHTIVDVELRRKTLSSKSLLTAPLEIMRYENLIYFSVGIIAIIHKLKEHNSLLSLFCTLSIVCWIMFSNKSKSPRTDLPLSSGKTIRHLICASVHRSWVARSTRSNSVSLLYLKTKEDLFFEAWSFLRRLLKYYSTDDGQSPEQIKQ